MFVEQGRFKYTYVKTWAVLLPNEMMYQLCIVCVEVLKAVCLFWNRISIKLMNRITKPVRTGSAVCSTTESLLQLH